jgi:hypothetical protein
MTKIACPCPPKAGAIRHPAGDEVGLRERLDFHSATTIRWAIYLLQQNDPSARMAEILAVLTEHYLLFGIETWTFVDEKGKPVEVTKTAIRQFLEEHPIQAQILGDVADGLYSQVMLPLLKPAQPSSPPTPTEPLTSAPTDSPKSPPKRSKRSSTSTTPTAATEPTSSSLDGDFNSLGSWVSAP